MRNHVLCDTSLTTPARPLLLLGLSACLVFLVAAGARATMPDGFNHPELRWQVIESPHFRVIFHQAGNAWRSAPPNSPSKSMIR